MLKNTEISYGSVSKWFHWGVALLMIIMLSVGFFMEDIPSKLIRSNTFTFHKSVGLIILTLVVFRFFWRVINKNPLERTAMLRWEKVLALFAHRFFYVLLIAMPLSGWLMSTASDHIPHFLWLFKTPMPFVPHSKPLAEFAAGVHWWLAWTILFLLSMHIAAALKHHFVDKDNVLTRMLPGRSR